MVNAWKGSDRSAFPECSGCLHSTRICCIILVLMKPRKVDGFENKGFSIALSSVLSTSCILHMTIQFSSHLNRSVNHLIA